MTPPFNHPSASKGDGPQEIPREELAADPEQAEGLAPLPGEAGIPSITQPRGIRVSWVRLGTFCGALVLATVLAVVLLQRYIPGAKTSSQAQAARASERPTAAAAEPRRLDLTPAPAPKASAPPSPIIPALIPNEAELEADPIGLRRSAQPSGTGRQAARPEDAPVLLVSERPGGRDRQPTAGESSGDAEATSPNTSLEATQRNLQAYQRQLDGLLNHLTRATEGATSRGAPSSSPGGGGGLPPFVAAALSSLGTSAGSVPSAESGSHPSGGLFGGQLQGSATPRVTAGLLGNRSLTLPKGRAFTCALKTKVVSAASGFVGCQVQRNVYSDDGRVLLIERGSHLDGEYRVTSVKPGTVRIPVLWTRIRTPLGVTVNVESPGTGPLGESGIDGYVDNRWSERIGAAMLLSLIDDAVQVVVQRQTTDGDATTLVLPSTTDNTSKLAEKVLDSTINIPPLIYQNQGGVVGIYVARDVDFSSVYELQPTPLAIRRGEAP